MKKLYVFFTFFCFVHILSAQYSFELDYNKSEDNQLNFYNLIDIEKFDSRRITGLVYSIFIPGSGQFYLGQKTKGALFAVTFISSLVGTLVSHNNFIGNRERIQSLEFEYLNSDRYTLSEYYWQQMVTVHSEQKLHEKSRNIFIASSIAIWTMNMIDYLFFTKDKGPIEFSSNFHLMNRSLLFSISVPINFVGAK